MDIDSCFRFVAAANGAVDSDSSDNCMDELFAAVNTAKAVDEAYEQRGTLLCKHARAVKSLKLESKRNNGKLQSVTDKAKYIITMHAVRQEDVIDYDGGGNAVEVTQ